MRASKGRETAVQNAVLRARERALVAVDKDPAVVKAREALEAAGK
jgi:hypothetical protein